METPALLEPSLAAPRPVLRWRREQLQAAGYSLREARELAERADIDLHVAADLLRAGCAPDVALRILL
jgi:hypothetical protein